MLNSFVKGTSPTTFGDGALVLKGNILQTYGGEPSIDGAPIAVGEIDGLLTGSLFLGLQTYFEKVVIVYPYEKVLRLSTIIVLW